MQRLFLSSFVALGLLAAPAIQAHSAEAVKFSAQLSQTVLPEGRDGRVYLRVALEGIPYEQEGERIPANVMLVIDQSGSMQGDRIEQAREAALMAVERLGDDDVLGIVSYSDNAYVHVPAGELRDVSDVRAAIRRLEAGGRTALYAGVSQGLRELGEFVDPYKVNRVILLSDGLANVGPSTPRELAALGREAAQQGISVTTIGLGLGYNEDLMTQLALASDGNHAFVEDPEDLISIFNAEFGDVLAAVGGEVEIIIECPDGFEPARVLGREARIEDGKVILKLNQLYARQEKYVIVELSVADERATGEASAASVEVKYTDLRSKERRTISGDAMLKFSASDVEVKAGVNKAVHAAVATQIATERSEQAVALRDSGKIEEARKLLQDNADYLAEEAGKLPPEAAAPLTSLAERNKNDAENLNGENWDRTRKSMRALQYKNKVQQSY